MEGFNNDDVKKMLEMLKEQAEINNGDANERINTQTTEKVHTDDDIKNMLKKHFSSDESESTVAVTDDYSLDDVEDFVADEEAVEDDLPKTAAEQTVEEFVEKVEMETKAETEAEVESETLEETSEAEEIEEIDSLEDEEKIPEELLLDEINVSDDEVYVSISEIDTTPDEEAVKFIEAVEKAAESIVKNQTDNYIEEPDADTYVSHGEIEEEPVSEESINYDEILEGQQGTVFNQFVEDFTGDLDDVVFEAEITESRAPDKQYTIFEDWEQIIKKKDFATAEEEIIPPAQDEFDQNAETDEQKRMRTDYFNPIVSDNDLDAVDIALMVALGGESELNQTVGFEKIRQAVHDVQKEEEESLEDKKIYGFTGEEYDSLVQNIKIKKKYKTDKTILLSRAISTAFLTIALMIYEILGWIKLESSITINQGQGFSTNILVGISILVICFGVSYNKFIKLFKEPMTFSSLSYLGSLLTLALAILHDVLIVSVNGYAHQMMTFHSASAILLLLSLIYDVFDFIQQSYMFNIISLSDKKLVLEPYGKIKTDDDSEMIESDSYCISRVPTVKKYFARTSAPTTVSMSKLIPLVLSFSIAICVMLLLLLMPQNNNIMFGFIITLSFLLICTSIFESEFAFFQVHRILKKYKTGIIGKSSVAEYGKCNVVYFDDFNVFNKKSVRTKGLKLYDNNEIYRILYHTQAVFSKVGGPLKGVFEFATTEMTHSNKVEIKEISKEGISAIVDGRTSVLIGTGAFMRSRYIHPSYTSADLKLEESGEESIMFIALNGVLGAKLYVTYQFSSEFERLARKLTKRGVRIGIRSADPNVNNKWAKKYSEMKKFDISIVRPTLKEIKPSEKSIESGVVSVKNVRALAEALMMCIKLNNFESLMAKIRVVALVLMGILSFALVLLSGINTLTILAMSLALALCTSVMALLTYFYIKN